MIAYVKDRKTFKTTHKLDVLSSSVVIDSIYDDVSKMTVFGEEIELTEAGSFLLCDGEIWQISNVAKDDGKTTLTLTNILSAFNRSLVYDGQEKNVAGRIQDAFIFEFCNLSDPEYAMPFVTVHKDAITSSIMQPDVEDGLWSLKSFIRKVWRLTDVRTRFVVTRDTLHIYIENAEKPQKTIVLGDGHSTLDTVDYSCKSIAKLTTIQGGNVIDWYLDKDGNVSDTIPENRAEGEWRILNLNENDDVFEKVADEFAQNSTSHKITFYSDVKLNLRDQLRIRMNGTVLSSYVAYVGKDSSDDRYYIKSGELLTTLTEKVAAINVNGGSVGSSETAEYASTAGYASTANEANTAKTAEKADVATSAETATIATKAEQDGAGNVIADTYYPKSNPSGYTSNAGTVTGIKMNGSSKGSSGVVDLGNVATLDSNSKLTASQGESRLNGDITANYTVVAADRGTMLKVNSSSDVTITIPTIANGAELEVLRWGSGKVTLSSGTSGYMFRYTKADGSAASASSMQINGQYGTVALKQITSSSCLIKGDFAE